MINPKIHKIIKMSVVGAGMFLCAFLLWLSFAIFDIMALEDGDGSVYRFVWALGMVVGMLLYSIGSALAHYFNKNKPKMKVNK